ncbi:MAG: hypothetical protein K0Q87_3108 [Neobacillus sp.]|nr:hypothetical protein [Neobacillus sp.]
MACKNSNPPQRCGECSRLDRESYKGAGLIVCYELNFVNGRKVATTVSKYRKACGKYCRSNQLNIANYC